MNHNFLLLNKNLSFVLGLYFQTLYAWMFPNFSYLKLARKIQNLDSSKLSVTMQYFRVFCPFQVLQHVSRQQVLPRTVCLHRVWRHFCQDTICRVHRWVKPQMVHLNQKPVLVYKMLKLFSLLFIDLGCTRFRLVYYIFRPFYECCPPPSAVVPKLFRCADHLKNCSAARSTKYWFV